MSPSASMSAPVRSSDFVYDCVLVFFRIVASIFFREIRPRGAYNIPKTGPVIFVAAPHHNQFVDPPLLASEVYRETRRRVEFITAAKSMQRRVVGFFASLISSIPVARASDEASSGTGTISLSPDDPRLVIGHGTKFSTELKLKWQIMLPKSVGSLIAEVSDVISDTEVRIKSEFGGDMNGTTHVRDAIIEAQKAGGAGLPFKRLPFIDQKDMYQFVYKRLSENGCLGIFPEGGSHDRPDLLPLKAGVTIMALGAMANDPSISVKIVPVGLSYFHADRFRSRAVIEFGSAFDVPAELVELFKEGGTKKREACSKLLDLIFAGLKPVTLQAPDYETLMVIQAARRLYETPGQHLTLGQVVELNRRFLEAYLHFQDDPRVQKLKKNVLKYNRALRDLGLRDHQVPRAKPTSWKTLSLLAYRLVLLIAWSMLSLPGVILSAPVFILATIYSRKKAKEALEASTVKVAGQDVLASWKILISLGITPVLCTLYAFLATFIAIEANVPLLWRVLMPFITMIALPIMIYAALKFGEAGMDVLKSLRPLVIAIFPGQQRSLDRLKKMRRNLANELTELINELGPKLWNDFDNGRILVPSASVPPSTGNPGLWRRKSGNGGVDAQGNLLAHPMSWLDERLFGWNRSAAQTHSGQSVEKIGSASNRGSSEEDDSGDYEHLLGYNSMDSDASPAHSRPRSLRSSYVDLQQLKTSPNVVSLHNQELAKLGMKNRRI